MAWIFAKAKERPRLTTMYSNHQKKHYWILGLTYLHYIEANLTSDLLTYLAWPVLFYP